LPSRRLYCQNLPDKIRKAKLRRAMYILSASYGPVLDVVALKTDKMRGQAHVVFRDIQCSSQALRALQGHELCHKEMRVAYAKGKSNTVAKLDGTFQIPVMRPLGEASTTDVQRDIFDGPPTTLPTRAPATTNGAASPPQGEKRQGDEHLDAQDDEDEGDAMMEESDED
ncbi:hypothetical protein K490DRAFT_49682, partial [Saccharata proteae CBS 121410]